MLSEKETDLSIFSEKVRVRACGLLEENGKMLLIKHQSIGKLGYLWAPPGGGVDFGQSVEETLRKEFLEETSLKIEVSDFLFVNEFIGPKHHAIELFYRVNKRSGTAKLGIDPELSDSNQILTEINFFTPKEIQKLEPDGLHSIFNEVNSPEKVFDLRGLFSFKY